MKRLGRSLGFVTALLLALMAGFFYSFSVTVMPGLDRAEPDVAIIAMQQINAAVRNPVFFVTFFLTPVLAGVSAILAWHSGLRWPSLWFGLAAMIYLCFALVPTVMINVPMNEALALVAGPQPGQDPVARQALWTAYSGDWTFWNTGRTLTTLLALLAALVALAWRSDTN